MAVVLYHAFRMGTEGTGLGALERSREMRDAKDLLPVNFIYN
jgi:hypothetical protein